jgi:heme exporter protein A
MVVELSNLCKQIDDRPILHNITFSLAPGEYLALLGANGAGKSTLLKVLATLIPPSSGSMLLFGENAGSAKLRARIGMIGHQPMLYGELTALENLIFFAKLYGVENANRPTELLKTVGLAHRANDRVKGFSRGMTQRVAIARALLHDPELILADEPFAGLDEGSSRIVENMLAELNSQGRTIILVNHSIERTLQLSKRTIVLKSGQILADEASNRLSSARIIEEITQP